MKKCLKCNNDLPNMITINGKKHNICNRKFCLECSPFKAHNTSNLLVHSINEGTTKKCSICNIEKDINEFYKKRDQSRKKFSSNCKSCENTRSIQRQRDLKQKAIDYKGGCCQICNYDKYNGALEFHHKDPSIKDFSLGHAKMYSFEKVKSELDKCILVCANCHREIHGGIIEIPPKN
jgi:hypothetical protein